MQCFSLRRYLGWTGNRLQGQSTVAVYLDGSFVFMGAQFDDGRHTHRDRVRRHIFGYDSVRADGNVIANSDGAQNFGTTTYVNTITYDR